jgi:hypothetical protein
MPTPASRPGARPSSASSRRSWPAAWRGGRAWCRRIFTDNPTPYVSLINLATVREIAGKLGREALDPLRFRANLYVDDLDPWAELSWVGKELVAGEVRFACAERIDRCAATNVDPATGARDLNIPLALRQSYSHIDCGVLLGVARGGRLETGQSIAPA